MEETKNVKKRIKLKLLNIQRNNNKKFRGLKFLLIFLVFVGFICFGIFLVRNWKWSLYVYLNTWIIASNVRLFYCNYCVGIWTDFEIILHMNFPFTKPLNRQFENCS